MRATQQEYEKIKEAFEILSGEMDDRDEDCAIPKNAVDKGYSLAVEHMKREMEEILTNISSNIKIQPNNTDMISKTEVIQMLRMLNDYLIFDLKEQYNQIRFRDEKNLVQVMKDIYSYTKHPFVILIDEWDCLFREYQQDQEIKLIPVLQRTFPFPL